MAKWPLLQDLLLLALSSSFSELRPRCLNTEVTGVGVYSVSVRSRVSIEKVKISCGTQSLSSHCKYKWEKFACTRGKNRRNEF